jgi:hypothetical protein
MSAECDSLLYLSFPCILASDLREGIARLLGLEC